MTDSAADDPRWFWEIIESSGRNLRKLSRRLELLSEEDLQRYHETYEALKERVNPHLWDDAFAQLTEPCSEDGADDFAAWVVMQGSIFFADVASHPEEIGRYLTAYGDCEAGESHPELRWDEEVDRDEYRGYQRADYIASAVLRSRFGDGSSPNSF